MSIGQGTQQTMRAWALRLYPRLYPRDWRARYGEEFAALLEDYPLTPYALFDLFMGALDAHLTPFDANGRILRMLNQPRRSVITVFIAYIAFVLAGGSFSNMIEDDVKTLNPAHPAIAAAYDVVLVMAFVSLLAVLVGGLPIGLAVIRRAIANHRGDILLLMAVPPISLAIWLGWLAILLNVIAPQADKGAVPQSSGGLFFLSLAGLFVLAAIASTSAVTIAVSRSELPPRLYRFALAPAAVAVLAMLVVFGGVLVWGLLIQAQDPSYLNEAAGPPPYSIAIGVGWAVDLVVMALAIIIAATALLRARRAPDLPAGSAAGIGAA